MDSETVQGRAEQAVGAARELLAQAEAELQVARALAFFLNNGPRAGRGGAAPAPGKYDELFRD